MKRIEFWLGASKPVVAVLLAIALAACTSETTGGSTNAGAPKIEYKPSDFTATGYCPPMQLRVGTESLVVYERGHDNDPAYIRYQASIGRKARECHTVGTTLTVKVGIAGRVVGGPKAAAGTVTLPIRVVVVRQIGGAAPLYSQLVKVPVQIAPPEFGANFNQVVENVAVEIGPQDRDLIIYVGFDDGPKG